MQNQDFCCKRRFSFIYKDGVMKNCSILILFHLCWLSLFIPTFGVRGETVRMTNERETLLKLKHHFKDASNTLSSWNATVDSNSSKSSFVPKWIFGLKRLVSLSITFNNFKGPDSIRNLVFLENLDLSDNSFSSEYLMVI